LGRGSNGAAVVGARASRAAGQRAWRPSRGARGADGGARRRGGGARGRRRRRGEEDARAEKETERRKELGAVLKV
jgi:hypothetical protein